MARRGVKRPRENDDAQGRRFYCLYENCPYWSTSNRATKIHTAKAVHYGDLIIDQASQGSELCSTSSSRATETESSNGNESQTSSLSGAYSDASDAYMPHDGPCEELDGAQHAEQPASELESDDSHAPSEPESVAPGMNIPLGAAHGPAPGPAISAHGSSSSSSSSGEDDCVQDSPQLDGPPANARRLTETDVRLHDLLNGLPLQRQQDVIDFLLDSNLDLSALTVSSARRLREQVKASSKQNWRELKLGECDNGFPVVVHYREDVTNMLQELLSHPKVKPSHFQPRERDEYEDARDGEWFREAWEYAQEKHPDADGVLPLIIYSDETHVSRSRNVHVLLVFVALPLHIMRAQGGLFRYLAFPPSFRGRDVGMPDDSQKSIFQKRKRAVKLAAIERALEGLKHLSYRSTTFYVGKGRTPMRLVPLPCNYVADGLEANLLLNVKNYPALHCDIHTTIERTELDDPDAVGKEVRTERGMKEVVRRVRELLESGTAAGRRAAKELMEQWSLQDTEESPLAGFAHTDCFELIWPDTLHQGAKGDVEKLLDLLTDNLSKGDIGAVNRQLASIATFPGYHPPSDGLSTPKMWASQQAAMFACLPVALLQLEGEFPAAMRIVIVAYLQFTAIRDLEVHTKETLAELDAKRRRFQILAVEQLGAYRPGGFRYPKFHANRKYPELIRRTGCVGLASAGYGEATHKLIKQAYQLSNKKSAGLEQQICEYTSRVQQLRAEGFAGNTVDSVARSAGQRAVQQKRRELVASSRTLDCRELTGNGRAKEWLTDRPELKELAPSLHRAMPEGERPRNSTVQVHPGLALPLQLHRKSELEAVILRALPEFGASKRPAYSFVSVRAGNDEHWFAQLRLLLSFRDAAGAEHRLAFLRWLSSTGGAEVPMQRLAWAKQGPAGGTQRAWYECVDVDTIERPVFLQPDPKHEGCFYYNHFMGSVLS